jgi:hypothetical protein
MKILNRFTGKVLFEGEYASMLECVKAALKAGANLGGAYLADANLADADLADADLAGAYLADANLVGAYLAGAYLVGADLGGADLADANLVGANLGGADLAGANLADADLAGADLAGADLADANLGGADLAGARNVPETNGTGSIQEPADRKERARLRALRFRERNPTVPVVEALDAKILDAVTRGGGTLDMSSWHKCETTHCRAGWAITLAGKAGVDLESQHGPQRAGAMIYRASTGRVPHFFASTERAMEDIRRCAEEGA